MYLRDICRLHGNMVLSVKVKKLLHFPSDVIDVIAEVQREHDNTFYGIARIPPSPYYVYIRFQQLRKTLVKTTKLH